MFVQEAILRESKQKLNCNIEQKKNKSATQFAWTMQDIE